MEHSRVDPESTLQAVGSYGDVTAVITAVEAELHLMTLIYGFLSQVVGVP